MYKFVPPPALIQLDHSGTFLVWREYSKSGTCGVPSGCRELLGVSRDRIFGESHHTIDSHCECCQSFGTPSVTPRLLPREITYLLLAPPKFTSCLTLRWFVICHSPLLTPHPETPAWFWLCNQATDYPPLPFKWLPFLMPQIWLPAWHLIIIPIHLNHQPQHHDLMYS